MTTFFFLLNFHRLNLQTNSLRFSDLMYKNNHFYIIDYCNLTDNFWIAEKFLFVYYQLEKKKELRLKKIAFHTLSSFPLFFMFFSYLTHASFFNCRIIVKICNSLHFFTLHVFSSEKKTLIKVIIILLFYMSPLKKIQSTLIMFI